MGLGTNLFPKRELMFGQCCEVSVELTTIENVKSPMRCTFDQDLALVHACKSGDAAAFEELVKRYDAKLFRIAHHITHNREDAEETVQDAFLKAFRNLSSFQEKSQFSTWLFRITVNESLMKLRKRRQSREVSIEEGVQEPTAMSPLEIPDWAPNPEQLYGASEMRNILRDQLQELQPSLRVTFILRDIEGLSTEETAEVLDLTVDAVKARLWRGRLKLRQLLTKYFGVSVTRTKVSSAERERCLAT
jgi:RNA polymerase sigma-70 factor, ECF subfamily